MLLKKEDGKSGVRILLIFTSFACLRKRLPDDFAGICRMILFPDDTGFSYEVAVELSCGDGVWQIRGKNLDGTPIYLYTEKNEKLLFLLSEKRDLFRASDCICLKEEEVARIGKDFKNQIFYDCFSMVDARHTEIAYGKEGYVIFSQGLEGIYVNEKSFSGTGKLKAGDRVDIYGLHLLVLKGRIVCVPFCGICRVIPKKEKEEKLSLPVYGQREQEAGWVERRCWQEQELHKGEVEIILPKEQAAEQRYPLILSVGPSLTMVLPMLLMAQIGSSIMKDGSGAFYYMSVAMSGCSALLGLFWGLAGYGYQKRISKKEGKEREGQYRKYLEETERTLLELQKENREILDRRYPPFSYLAGGEIFQEEGMPVVLWNRYYRQADFLFLRIGKGEEIFQVKVKLEGQPKGILQDRLVKDAKVLAERFRFLKDVPLGVDLFENRQIGILGEHDRKKMEEMIFHLLMQIAACHCYTEVKTVCFYRKERKMDRRIAECLRWMPHSWSGDRKVRFLAGCEKEAAEILPVLSKELIKGREETERGMRIPWYIVLVLDEELILGEPLYHYLTEQEKNYPASAVFAKDRREELPKSCRYFITPQGVEGEILNIGKERISRKLFQIETCSSYQAEKYARQTAGFQVREAQDQGQLPDQVDFLRLYGCSRAVELESGRRWREARTEERLKVPIGCRAGGNVVNLDIHEKFHGPHGLIAGTTGSGKSELLQTYLLSMAISFSPFDVNFFMIDYKGGGTGNALKKLPHCAGVISNLSGKQIKRAMLAITSENKRRQRVFGKYQVNHIDAYTKLYREGRAHLPMPHLLLVVDEFAELKKEEPEFMQEIISLAQVGRSLGMHLILATQKPAGTIDDKIWSNARFRLCLRVQDGQDSLDMLHNKDAAALSFPGQCYLQIGNHEYYELFQAGYCGGFYHEGEEEKPRAALLSNTGRRMERTKMSKGESEKKQMEVLVDYVSHMAENHHFPSAALLWLPELPEKVTIGELSKVAKKERERENIALIEGLCDDPENQRQFRLDYRPMAQGHLAVFGGPATGKTSHLQMLLWQLGNEFTADEALFLAVDIRQKCLGCFSAMPNCLGVLTEKEYKEIFFNHLCRFVDRRKERLSGTGFGQYNKSGKERLPLVFLVVDDFGDLAKILDEKQYEMIIRIASEGLTLGIYLILSASGVGEVGGKLYEKIKTAVAFEMSDRFQYGDVFRQYSLPILPMENQKGRGLCRAEGRVLEFQAACLGEEITAFSALEKAGEKRLEELKKEGAWIPEKFPVIPEKMDFVSLAEKYDWKKGEIPLGYCLSTGECCGIFPGKRGCFLISGNEGTGRKGVLSYLVEGFLRHGGRAVVLDMGGWFMHFKGRKEIDHLREEKEIDIWRKAFEKENGHSGRAGVFIANMADFCRYLYRVGKERDERITFWEQAAMGSGEINFMAGICNGAKEYEVTGTGFFREFVSWQQGIHLGGNVAAQRALSFDDLAYEEQNRREMPGIGYFKNGPGSITRRLKLPEYEREK